MTTARDARGRIPREMREALDASGLSWVATMGKRHVKVVVEGRLVTVQPLNGSAARGVSPCRHLRNSLATVRRSLVAICAQRTAGSAELSANVGKPAKAR